MEAYWVHLRADLTQSIITKLARVRNNSNNNNNNNNNNNEVEALPVTGRGGLWCCEMSRIIGQQMAVRLSALLTGRTLSPEIFSGTYLLDAESVLGP
jgi:hypothetical protein